MEVINMLLVNLTDGEEEEEEEIPFDGEERERENIV